MTAVHHAVSSCDGFFGSSGRGLEKAPVSEPRIASWRSASFDPKYLKIVTSFTAAASAMRRVVEPRKPCWEKTCTAALRIEVLVSMAPEPKRSPGCMQVTTCLHQMFL